MAAELARALCAETCSSIVPRSASASATSRNAVWIVLLIGRDRGLFRGPGVIEIALVAAGVEQRQADRRAGGVGAAAVAEQPRQRAADRAERRGERDRGEERRTRRADIGVLRDQLMFGLQHVGPAQQHRRRQVRGQFRDRHVAGRRARRATGRRRRSSRPAGSAHSGPASTCVSQHRDVVARGLVIGVRLPRLQFGS